MRTALTKLAMIAIIIAPSTLFAARSECIKASTANIKNNTITSTQIADGSIQSNDIANGAIDGRHIEELVTIPKFVLAPGEKRDILDTGDIRLEANCYSAEGFDTATVNVHNITDGAMLMGASAARTNSGVVIPGSDEQYNLTSSIAPANRELHRAAAVTGNPGHDYPNRGEIMGADGSFIKTQMYVSVNLKGEIGCHFAGVIHVTPAS